MGRFKNKKRERESRVWVLVFVAGNMMFFIHDPYLGIAALMILISSVRLNILTEDEVMEQSKEEVENSRWPKGF